MCSVSPSVPAPEMVRFLVLFPGCWDLMAVKETDSVCLSPDDFPRSDLFFECWWRIREGNCLVLGKQNSMSTERRLCVAVSALPGLCQGMG